MITLLLYHFWNIFGTHDLTHDARLGTHDARRTTISQTPTDWVRSETLRHLHDQSSYATVTQQDWYVHHSNIINTRERLMKTYRSFVSPNISKKNFFFKLKKKNVFLKKNFPQQNFFQKKIFSKKNFFTKKIFFKKNFSNLFFSEIKSFPKNFCF